MRPALADVLRRVRALAAEQKLRFTLKAVRELAAVETHALRWSVSADGRTDLVTVHHELDDSPGAWHLGAVDETGRVVAAVAISTGTAHVSMRKLREEFVPQIVAAAKRISERLGYSREGTGRAVPRAKRRARRP